MPQNASLKATFVEQENFLIDFRLLNGYNFSPSEERSI
jgi:hypothetical protein